MTSTGRTEMTSAGLAEIRAFRTCLTSWVTLCTSDGAGVRLSRRSGGHKGGWDLGGMKTGVLQADHIYKRLRTGQGQAAASSIVHQGLKVGLLQLHQMVCILNELNVTQGETIWTFGGLRVTSSFPWQQVARISPTTKNLEDQVWLKTVTLTLQASSISSTVLTHW